MRINSHTDVGPKKTCFFFVCFMTRSFYKAGVHKKGFAFDKLLFFSALKRSVNNANKISASKDIYVA